MSCTNTKQKYTNYTNSTTNRVGCTVVTETGELISGANIENASYGGSICAERTTISKAIVCNTSWF